MALDALIIPRLREASFVLSPIAYGIAIDSARFHAVARWVRKTGQPARSVAGTG